MVTHVSGGLALSVVVPTYNERARLEELVRTIASVFTRSGLDAELVIVDDNSPDGTGRLADALARQYPMRVVHRSGKLGLGSAVMAGIAVACGEVLGVMDGDMSHPPEALPDLVRVLEESGADLVIASRYVEGGGVRNWPMGRRAMSRIACLLARPITPVRDSSSGFFVVRREAIRDVQIQSGGFKICLELLVRGHVRRVAEMPYVFTDRAEGESKMSWREASGYLKQLVMLWNHQRRNSSPRPEYRSAAIPPARPVHSSEPLNSTANRQQ
jgi:dolichol-phosphate mannosyltransferase